MKFEHMETNMDKKDVLDQYIAQTAENEDVHFSHADWIYSDSSDCCC
ncbi:MAG: hypothetical protein IJW14_02830 [Oscillospiraceae bacterium]|nr:hypothetical protein [Oscillospiraceae bacterium]